MNIFNKRYRSWLIVLVAGCVLWGCAGTKTERDLVGRGVRVGDQVHLVTSRGTIVIALFANEIPENTANFADLVTFGFYEGHRFFEVVAGSFAKTGCPRGDGLSGPGYMLQDEFHPDLTFDRPGIVAMANGGPDANGSQFFITMRALPEFNNKYTIIGEVIDGADIVEQLTISDYIVSAWIKNDYMQ